MTTNETDLSQVTNDPPPKDDEIHVLIRSGRLNINQPSGTAMLTPPPEEDIIIKQLKKARVDVNIWQLIVGSKSHCDALLDALTKMKIADDVSPEGLLNIVFNEHVKPAITFSEEDLPEEGSQHNKALYITMICKPLSIPMALVDNGSTINVCPLRVAQRLGISQSEFAESNQAIRAYDNTRRNTLGVIFLNVKTGPIDRKVKFHVLDINANFNLLLDDLGYMSWGLSRLRSINRSNSFSKVLS